MLALHYIVKQLVLPPCSILVLLAIGFSFSLMRFRRLARVVLAGGIVSFYLVSINPTADVLLRSLESRHQPLSPEQLPRVGTLVVLGGGASATTGMPVSSRLSQASTRRVLEALRLYHLMDQPRIVASGGSGNPFVEVSEAGLMRELLLNLGIPDKRIMIEGKSRNTMENAKEIQRLRIERPLILITSAAHMSRALGVFRALGMKPLPAPCDFHAGTSINNPLRFLPSAGALAASAGAIYAHLGTWWYKLAGKLQHA